MRSKNNDDDKEAYFIPIFSWIVMFYAEYKMLWRLFTPEFWEKEFYVIALYLLMLPIPLIFLGFAFYVIGFFVDFFIWTIVNTILKRGRFR